jgi:hypothetical protein
MLVMSEKRRNAGKNSYAKDAGQHGQTEFICPWHQEDFPFLSQQS